MYNDKEYISEFVQMKINEEGKLRTKKARENIRKAFRDLVESVKETEKNFKKMNKFVTTLPVKNKKLLGDTL